MLRSIPIIMAAIQLSQPKVTPDEAQRFAAALHEQAQVHDFDPLTGVAMIFHESSFNPRAVSPNGEDWGLAQIRARHIGDCVKSSNPVRNPTAECKAQKQRRAHHAAPQPVPLEGRQQCVAALAGELPGAQQHPRAALVHAGAHDLEDHHVSRSAHPQAVQARLAGKAGLTSQLTKKRRAARLCMAHRSLIHR